MRYIVLLFLLGIGFLFLGLPGEIPYVGMQVSAPMNVTIASWFDLSVSDTLIEGIFFTDGPAGDGTIESVTPGTNDNNASWNWNGTGPNDVATLYNASTSKYTNTPIDICSNADKDLWDMPMQHYIGIGNVTQNASLITDNDNPDLPGTPLVKVADGWITTWDDFTPPTPPIDYNYTYLRYWFDAPSATSEIPAVAYNTTYVIKAVVGGVGC